MRLLDSVLGLALSSLHKVFIFTKSVSESRLEMLSSEVDSSETSHRNRLKQKLIFRERSHGFPPGRHQLCGYMPRELEKLHNLNMVKKNMFYQ